VASDAPFHKVRWHVPAKSLGVTLPPGYHLLEAPLQLFLCYGDQEIARFQPGVDPKAIQREAEAHAAKSQTVQTVAVQEDGITGLPWSISLRGDAARLAAGGDLHVIAVSLTGLDTLMDVYGYKAAHSVLRQISRRMKRLMDDRDRLTRHCGDKLLIFTTRALDEVKQLVDMIHQQVAAVGLETDGDRLPHSRIGVATVDRLTDADPVAAQTVIDAVIISAEVASVGAGTEARPFQVEPQGPAPAAAPVPQAFRGDVEPEMPTVEESPPPQVPAISEPVEAEAPRDLHVVSPTPEEPEPPVYELPVEPVHPESVQPEEVPAPLPEEAPPVAAPAPAAEEPATPAPSAPAQPAAMPVPAPDGAGRIRFKGASLDVSGMVATATVKLVLGEREVIGRAVGRNAQERRLFLAAEAAARAVTEFLPQGYGVVIHDIQPAPPEVGKALWAAVLFLTPNGEESLLGIAPIDDMAFEAAGKAVLNAVNRRVGLLLGSPS